MTTSVYVIGALDGPQKVGISGAPKNRLTLFQMGNGSKLVLSSTAEVEDTEALPVERYAHYLLREHSCGGEWFNVPPDRATSAVAEAVVAVRSGQMAPGEPSVETKTERFELRLTPAEIEEIDEWRRAQPDLPSRAEALRRLKDLGIRAYRNGTEGRGARLRE